MRRLSAVVALAATAVVGVAAWALWSGGKQRTVLLTAPVKRGDLVVRISATGTVEPVAAVDIGAQVAGVIVAFGRDKDGKDVTWGSVVDAGSVLARIDDSLYVAAVKTAQGQLAQAQANVLASQANVLQQKANLLYASQNWDRAQKLGPSDALAQSAYDQYQASYAVAKANLAAAEAAVEQAKAAVEAAKASLLTAQTNLNYCTIKSPVKGTIIDRRVNIGQTVVSSLSAPSLFLIASDLSDIQVWVSVNEADVGSIAVGQPVTFTVDAFPGKVFHGIVGQVRLNATMTQNVVTYTIEVDFDNSQRQLLPYLTANVQFETGNRKDVLLVPNGTLLWSPRPEQITAEFRQARSRAPRHEQGFRAAAERGTIWVAQGRFVRPIAVTVGLSDGILTEVQGKGLTEGLLAVIGEGTPETRAALSTERNPFVPQVFRGGRQGQEQSQAGPGQSASAPARP